MYRRWYWWLTRGSTLTQVAERPPGARDAGSVMIGLIASAERERNMTGEMPHATCHCHAPTREHASMPARQHANTPARQQQHASTPICHMPTHKPPTRSHVSIPRRREFVGRSSIAEARKNSELWIRTGLELEGRRAAREDCKVFQGEQEVGVVTSGSYTPTLQKSISMAYIHPEYREPGTALSVDIRGKLHKATVVQIPFYQRPV